MKTAALPRACPITGRLYFYCRHDPTEERPTPCEYFIPLSEGHPFAGFCKFNMSKPDSQEPEDFGDLCYSRAAINAVREAEKDREK